jgi:hypothetical protein
MKDHSQENSMVTGEQYEESTERPEPEFKRQPVIQGTLESRVSAMILHISSHGSFDKEDLIDLLKDVNKVIREESQQIDRLDDLCERLENTTSGRRQA